VVFPELSPYKQRHERTFSKENVLDSKSRWRFGHRRWLRIIVALGECPPKPSASERIIVVPSPDPCLPNATVRIIIASSGRPTCAERKCTDYSCAERNPRGLSRESDKFIKHITKFSNVRVDRDSPNLHTKQRRLRACHLPSAAAKRRVCRKFYHRLVPAPRHDHPS
jgi:hypothetical protein